MNDEHNVNNALAVTKAEAAVMMAKAAVVASTLTCGCAEPE